MAITSGKILLCRLYEKTSARGNRYLVGYLGAATLIAFIDADAELKFGATAIFNVDLQAPDERKPSNDPSPTRNPQPPGGGTTASPPARVRQYRPSHLEVPPTDPGPFDDSIDDVGRSCR
jgi:hypothetical protein